MSRRSASAVIDLTSSSRSNPHIDLNASSLAGASSTNDPRQTSSHGEDDYIESVDLTEVNDDYALAKTLANQ
uniref:Uncharacterized protein n=1 Tax=Talaromyces marneffei PM1 TaxID=1077442 RepID=A0A093V3T3_TALMA